MTNSEFHKIFLTSTGISTDTRKIQKGNLFFALKGDNFNANKFAQQALDTGAAYAVIDDPEYQADRTILVKDALNTLQELAKYHRRQLNIPFIGLTGSNGKTTTKELIASVLFKKYKTAFTKGNLNNHIGVPLTLLSVDSSHEMAIVEMGANHQKEIEFLCTLAQPDYGYITNFGKAHLEGFGGIEGVIKGKSELYDYLRASDGQVFINQDDELQVRQSKGLKTISFSTGTDGDYQISQLGNSDQDTLMVGFEGHTITSNLTGTYNFSNIAAAIVIGSYFKVSPEDIKAAIENYKPTNNRSQITITSNNKLVLDTYNANPTSTEAAIRNFEGIHGDQKWLILGDMFELGEYAHSEHQKIVDIAGKADFEQVLLVGKEYARCRVESSGRVIQLDSTEELLKYLQSHTVTGKTILLKGSRGMKIESAIPYL